MIRNISEILNKLRNITDTVILFHSATGKDSIVLLDLLIKKNFKVIPVFMYLIKELEHIDRYIKWSEKKYNVKFIQVPHFVLSQIIKRGEYGIKKSTKQKIFTLKMINDKIIENTGINWTVMGFKKSDGLNRRIMLNELSEYNAFNFITGKCYPLSDWLNKECLAYIKYHNLIQPLIISNSPSQGCTPNKPEYLLFLKEKYPEDLKKIINVMPETEAILCQAEYKLKNEN